MQARDSVGRQFFEPEIVNLTLVAVAAINVRNCLASGFRRNSVTRTALLDNWIWGLSLIALTIAIHATSVTFMVSVLHSFRVQLESRRPGLRRLYAIVIGTITTMGLLLAALHVIEAALWAAVYLWLGAFGSLEAAILYSVDTIATRGASGLMLQSVLADDGRPRGRRRCAAVRYQHGLHLHGHAVLLSTPCVPRVVGRHYQG